MAAREEFIQAVINMENALASVLDNAVSANVESAQLERLLKLVLKKEIVLQLLLEEVSNGSNGENNNSP